MSSCCISIASYTGGDIDNLLSFQFTTFARLGHGLVHRSISKSGSTSALTVCGLPQRLRFSTYICRWGLPHLIHRFLRDWHKSGFVEALHSVRIRKRTKIGLFNFFSSLFPSSRLFRSCLSTPSLVWASFGLIKWCRRFNSIMSFDPIRWTRVLWFIACSRKGVIWLLSALLLMLRFFAFSFPPV